MDFDLLSLSVLGFKEKANVQSTLLQNCKKKVIDDKFYKQKK